MKVRTALAALVFAVGFAAPAGAISLPTIPLAKPPPSPAATQPGPSAYWLVGADGGVFALGGVPFEGSAAGRLAGSLVAVAPTPHGQGYWLASSAGSVYAFGDARYHGSTSELAVADRPDAPVVDLVATPDGGGYWVLTADGGVYTFGDAHYEGSLAGLPVGTRFVAMASTPDGRGYWLAGADGAVFSFGDARFFGAAIVFHPHTPVVGLASTPDGGGYWVVTRDGGVFAFGDAVFHGSAGGMRLNEPIVGMARSPSGHGYWLVASDGGIFAFGDAPFRGSTGGRRLAAPIVGMAVGRTLDPYPPADLGYDVSFPQCGTTLPRRPFGIAIVGVNDGRAFTHNPCLAGEAAWAGPGFSVYINLNAPPAGSTEGQTGPAGTCATGDAACTAYNFGYNAAADAEAYARSAGVTAGVWWLDIETANTWDTDTLDNQRTIRGALDALGAQGVVAGIYSTGLQWGLIAGSFDPHTPIWVATGSVLGTAVSFCSPSDGFGGGVAWLTQFGSSTSRFDEDYACPAP